MKKTLEVYKEDLRTIRDIQGSDGNWNYDNYMCGLYNGIELSLAIIEGREPELRSLPKRSIFFYIKRWFRIKFYRPKAQGVEA